MALSVLSFFGVETAAIIIIAALLLTDRHLIRRDTAEAKMIFFIAILNVAGSVINMLSTVYDFNFYAKPGEKWFVLHAFILSLLCCIKEMMSVGIIAGWNLFIDYGIYRSNDHVIKKYKRIQIPCAVLSLLFILLYVVFDSYIKYGGAAVSVMNGFTSLCLVLQFVLTANACHIVLSAKKRRKPPSFLRLDVFIVPVVLGYILNLMPVINTADYRSICLAIAVVLTWRSVLNRYRYVDPYTGFFNRDFLTSMNEYMEKSGYPNGSGVYFTAPGKGAELIPILDSLKPQDAEIFSLGEDEYLLMAGPQKESVIKLLIKTIRLKASLEEGSMDIGTAYAIREKEESTGAFTDRLLKLPGSRGSLNGA